MKKLEKFRLKTERCLLVPVSLKYKKDAFEEFTDKITKYMHASATKNIKESENYIINRIKEAKLWKNLLLDVIDNDTWEFIWRFNITEINTKTPKIWLWIKLSKQWQWYWKEITKWVMDWFDKNINYDYLNYWVERRNIKSRKIPEFFWWVLQDWIIKNITDNWKSLEHVKYKIYNKDHNFFLDTNFE